VNPYSAHRKSSRPAASGTNDFTRMSTFHSLTYLDAIRDQAAGASGEPSRPRQTSASAADGVAARHLGLMCPAAVFVVRHAWLVAKYDGLAELLRRRGGGHVTLTFEQVASAVPGGLPPSAYRHRAWWANESSGPHVHAKAWREAGWLVTTVDLAGRTVTFGRAREAS
jgi:hypothetical protein